MRRRTAFGASAAAAIGATLWVATAQSSDALPPMAKVDRIYVDKSEHLMTVYSAGRAVHTFPVALGRGGLGPKEKQGDGRVPEGRYRITSRNPKSAFYLSLGIGYPTPEQISAARARGLDPGGDIMIHGLPKFRGWLGTRHRRMDWTQGCIAVTNEEMRWLWQAVPEGTTIGIVA